MKTHNNLFEEIVSLENLFYSWEEFRLGKRKKKDVKLFEQNLEDNLFALYFELKNKTYHHSEYSDFYITDPKPRHIFKACVRDRVVHHAVYRILYQVFDETFISASYSCRTKKGTHSAVRKLQNLVLKISKNYSKPCFALKCDVRKFFDSVDQEILLELIKRKISDKKTIALLEEVIGSYFVCSKKGIPIGNLTSQLFANIYLNELDQFIKHKLQVKNYLRYCDDFIILADNRETLESLVAEIEKFLSGKLKLRLHKSKVNIRKLSQGIDFLGFVVLPYHAVLRIKTKWRMIKQINWSNTSSYLGLLKHCNSRKLRSRISQIDNCLANGDTIIL